MKQTLNRPIPLLHPTLISLVGTMYKNSPNFTTIADIAVAGLNPPLIMISIHQNHACMEYINRAHTFSVNIPTIDLVKEVDFAGIYSGKSKDKSNLFDVDYIDQIPVIKSAPIQLIVKEKQRVQIEHRVILVCKVIKTYVDTSLIETGKLDLSNIKTVLYGLDNKYYSVGDITGTAYHEGYKL